MIHADFSGRVSVLVVKRPDMFGFRNPGLMRVPPELAVQGGTSDCRNRRLQTLFQLVGYGDHADSGLPKIYRNWAGQHWRRPVLYEIREPEQTLMELRSSSLVPADVLVDLQARLGERFAALPELARMALITASAEGMLNHARLREISTDHPADITKMLATLVRDGLLAAHGTGRGMVYSLPWQTQTPAMVFEPGSGLAPAARAAVSPELGRLPPELGGLPPELGGLPPESGAPTPTDVPVCLDWSQLSPELQAELTQLALPVSAQARISPALLQQTLLRVCRGRYLGLRVLAHVLKRDADDLRKRTLTPMVKAGALKTAFAAMNDPRQAYTTAASNNENMP